MLFRITKVYCTTQRRRLSHELIMVNAAVNVTSVPPSSHTRHLFDTWEKNRGPEFNTFSPGTEYHFARNSFFPQAWRLRAHHFSLLWTKGQVFDTSVIGYK
jgi:hypothetical protein